MNPTTLKLRRTGKLVLLLTVLCTGQLFGMEPEWSLPKAEHISQLPKEIQQTIINSALAASNTLSEAINAIKSASVMYGIRYDMLNEDTLMHTLTKKFPEKVKEEISVAIERPELYQELVNILEESKNSQFARQIIISKNLLPNNFKDFTALVHMIADKFNLMNTGEIALSFSMYTNKKPIPKKYYDLNFALLSTSDLPKVAQFITKGADVNIIGPYPRPLGFATPLIFAAKNNDIAFVKVLLNAGANPNLKVDGKKALDMTTNEEIKTLLEEAMKNW